MEGQVLLNVYSPRCHNNPKLNLSWQSLNSVYCPPRPVKQNNFICLTIVLGAAAISCLVCRPLNQSLNNNFDIDVSITIFGEGPNQHKAIKIGTLVCKDKI